MFMKEKATVLSTNFTSVDHGKENTALPANLKEILQKTDSGSQEVVYSKDQLSRFLDACCDCV